MEILRPEQRENYGALIVGYCANKLGCEIIKNEAGRVCIIGESKDGKAVNICNYRPDLGMSSAQIITMFRFMSDYISKKSDGKLCFNMCETEGKSLADLTTKDIDNIIKTNGIAIDKVSFIDAKKFLIDPRENTLTKPAFANTHRIIR